MIKHYMDDRIEWMRISDYPPPDLERVMVCGWQPKHGRCAGYWWFEEAVFSDNTGRIDKKGSEPLYWCPIILPEFPSPPFSEV